MRKQITNDIILRIMQNTYLFRVKRVDELLAELFFRYINTLDYLNAHPESKNALELLNSARAILYFIGYFFCENFGRGAIERRLTSYSVDPLRFYEIVDGQGTFDLTNLKPEEAKTFLDIIEYYKMLKRWKNLVVPGHKLYLAEDYYNETRERLL